MFKSAFDDIIKMQKQQEEIKNMILDEIEKYKSYSDAQIKKLLLVEAAKRGISLKKLSSEIPCSSSYLYHTLKDPDYPISEVIKLRLICYLIKQNPQ